MVLAQQKSGAVGLCYLLLYHLSLEEWLPVFQTVQMEDVQLMAMTESSDFEKMGIPSDDSYRLASYIRYLHREVIGCISNEHTTKRVLHGPDIQADLRPSDSSGIVSNPALGQLRDTEDGETDLVSPLRTDTLEGMNKSSNRASLCGMSTTSNSDTASVAFTPMTPPPRPMSMPLPSSNPFISSPPPLDYHHASILKRWERCRSCVLPREDEGREELPPYQCTVYKIGYAHVKREMETPILKSRWRSWGKLYLELWGTILHIYRTPPSKKPGITGGWLSTWASWAQVNPMETLNLAGADASLALDYTKRPNTMRLTTAQGPRLLIRLSSHAELVSWVEHLQAAINIALDLEQRPMPKFVTLPGRGLTASLRTARAIEIERLRDQRRREQPEMLI